MKNNMKVVVTLLLPLSCIIFSARGDETSIDGVDNPFWGFPSRPKQPPREVIDARTLDELLDRLENRSGVQNLKAALYWEFAPESRFEKEYYATPIDWEMYKLKVQALHLLYNHGNRQALPVIEKNLSLPHSSHYRTIKSPCLAMLQNFEDIHSADIRAVLSKVISKERLIKINGQWTHLAHGLTRTLEKDLDVRNVPLIVKTIRILGTKNGNLKVALRNVIHVETDPAWAHLARHPKGKFFPDWDEFIDFTMQDVDKVLETYEANKHRMPPSIERDPIDANSLDELLIAIEARTGSKEIKNVLIASLPDRHEQPRVYERIGRQKQQALEALYKYGNRHAVPVIKHNLALAAHDDFLIDNWCMFMLIMFGDITADDIREVVTPVLQAGRLSRDGKMTDFAAHVHWVLGKHHDVRNLPLIVQAIRFDQSADSKMWLQRELYRVIFVAYQPGPKIYDWDAKSKWKFFPEPGTFRHLTADDLAKILEIYNQNKEAIIEKNAETIIGERDKSKGSGVISSKRSYQRVLTPLLEPKQ